MQFSIRRGWGVSLLGLTVLLAPFVARADDDDALTNTNHVKRPIEELFRTDLVYPQEKGEVELEVGSTFQNHADVNTWTEPLSIEYGLTDSWQVEAEWDAWVQRYPKGGPMTRGIGDLEVGSQYSFMNIGDTGFHIAPRFTLQAPLGNVNEDLSDGQLEYEPAVILARDFPKWHTQFFTEAGFTLVQRARRPTDSDDAEPAAHYFDIGSGFFVLVPHGALTFEFNIDDNRWNNHGVDNELYVTPGYIWKINPSLEVGVGVPVGLTRASDHFDVMAHVVWEF